MSMDRNSYNVPDFMDIRFFEKVLRNGFDNSTINVTTVRVTGGTKPGENYSSQILRVSVKYSDAQTDTKTIALLVKYLEQTPVSEFVRKCGQFPRENWVYANIFPVLKDYMDGEDVAPRYFYYTEEPTETIVFEDVSPIGYKLGNAATGLDEEQCALLLRKLGKYHAASMMVAVKSPEIYEKFREDTEIESDAPAFFIDNIKHLVGIVATWPGYEDMAVKLERFIETIRNNPNIWGDPTENKFNVLVHGDLWTNNVLFKYEDGQVTDILFIDFQLSWYSSPGIDLMHFFYTSTEQDVLENKIEALVKEHYYEAFRTSLERSNYVGIPTFEDIRMDMERRTVVGFLWSMMQLFLICIGDDKEEISLTAFSDPEKGCELRNLGMNSERFVKNIKYILRQVEHAGYFK